MRAKHKRFDAGKTRNKRSRSWLLALAAASVSLVVSKSVQANTVSWAVDASGDWSTASNWSTANLPGAGDDVVLNRSSNAYTITLSSGQSINSFTNNDETLVISGAPLTLGAGSVSTNAAGATTNIIGGQISSSGATVNNLGMMTTSSGPSNAWGSGLTLNNSGTFMQGSSVGGTGFLGVFNNTGAVVVTTSGSGSTLSLAGGGTSTGSFSVGHELDFINYTLNPGTTVTGSGLVQFFGGNTVNIPWNFAGTTWLNNGGTTTFNQPVNVPVGVVTGTGNFNAAVTAAVTVSGGTANFNVDTALASGSALSGGSIGGTGNLTVGDSFSWTSGTIGGSGTLTVSSSGTLTGSGASNTGLNRNLINNGTANWTNTSGSLTVASGVIITNSAGATMNIIGGQVSGNGATVNNLGMMTTSSGPSNAWGSGLTLNNSGTFMQGSSVGGTGFLGVFNNTGAVVVTTSGSGSTLSLAGGGTSTGSFSVGHELDFINYTLNPGTTVTGSGLVQFFGGNTVNIPWNFAGTTWLNNGGTTTFNQPVNVPVGVVTGTGNFNAAVTAAVTVSGGTANFNVDTALASGSALSGGSIGGTGNLTVGDSFSWTSGTIGGSGTLTVSSSGTLTGSGASNTGLNRNLINNGTANWTNTSGSLTVASGVIITNSAGATMNIIGGQVSGNGATVNNLGMMTTSSGPSNAWGSGITLNNSGTFMQGSSVGGTGFLGVFNNTGAVVVTTSGSGSTLSLAGGGTSTGSFSVGHELDFTNYTLNPGTTVTGSGLVQFFGGNTVNIPWNFAGTTWLNNGGTTTFNQPVNVPVGVVTGTGNFNAAVTAAVTVSGGTANFNVDTALASGSALSGGSIGGTGNLTVGDSFSWTSGTIGGSGTLTVSSSGTLTGSGASNTGLNRNLINNGTANWTNTSGSLTVASGVIITNSAGATMNIIGGQVSGNGATVNNLGMMTTSSGPSNAWGSGLTLNNSGTFMQGSSVGGTGFLGVFNNTGSVVVTTSGSGSTLSLAGGGTSTGSFSVGHELDFINYTLNPGTTVTGSGLVQFFGGNTVNIPWNFAGTTWLNNGGTTTFNQPVNVPVGVVTGTGNFNAAVTGTVTVSGGTANFAGGGTGSVLCEGSSAIFSSAQNGSQFANVGVTAGAVTVSAGGSLAANAILYSGGTIAVLGGSSSGTLLVGNGIAGYPALTMTTQNLTLNAGASPGRLLLNGDVSFNNNSGTVSILTSTVGPGQVAGTVDLDTGVHRLTTADGGTVSITARIIDGGFIKDGNGTLDLSNSANSLAGGITVLAGTLELTTASQISGGITLGFEGPLFGLLPISSDSLLGAASNSLTLAGGTLQLTSSFGTSRSIMLGDSGGNGNGTILVNPSVTFTDNGPVGGLAGLIKQGAGTLILDGSLSYVGSTKIQAGTLSLGPGIIFPSQSVVSVAPGASLDMSNQASPICALQDISGAGGSGTISLGSATLTVGSLGASTIFSGNINGSTGGAIVMSGAGSMALTGSLTNFTGGASVTQGTLLLGGSANTFTGGVSASHGTLSVSSDGAMGNASNVISLSSGGTLAVTSSFSTSRHLSIGSGSGIQEVGTSDTLIDSGLIIGSTPLTLSGTGGTAGGGGLLNLTSAESYSGLLTIDGSSASAGEYDTTLLLSGAATMDALSTLSLIRQGTLEVYDGSGLTSGRLGASTALNLSGGTLSIMGSNSAIADESMGKLDLLGGTSTIDLIDGSSGSVDLTFGSYARTPGAQLFIDMSPSDAIYFTSMPTGLISGVTLVEDALMGHAQYSQTLGVEFFDATMPTDTITPAFTFSAAPSPVPEPASLGLVVFVAVGFSRRRSRRPGR